MKLGYLKSLGALGPELRKFKTQIWWVIILGILVSGTNAVIPLLVQNFFDALSTKDERIAILIPLTFPFIYLVNGICRYYHMYIMRFVGEQLTMEVRKKLLNKYLSLSLSFHNTYRGGSGGLISRTLNDVSVLQNGVGVLATIVREPLVAVFLTGYLFYTDWKLTAGIMLCTPIFLIALKQTAKSLRKYGHNNQNEMETLTSTLKESLDGVRVIQSFNLEKEMNERFKQEGDKYLDTRRLIISREEISSPVNDVVAAAMFSAVCVYVAYEIVNGNLTLGQFTGYVAALGFFQKPVKNLQDSFIKLQQAVVVMDRISSIINEDKAVKQLAKPQTFPKSFSEIRFKNVGFNYEQSPRPILRNIDLTVRRGEVIAFVGESGSGKSTLVNLLPRFFDPSSGQILIDNTPIENFAVDDLRNHVALVTQDVFLFRDTISNNIRAGNPQKPVEAVEIAARAANAHDFIQRLPEKYETNTGERGGLLSGGERQRISIARAIYKDAPILILDEATSALDSASEVEVQKGLERLMQGRTVFVIAHRLSTVTRADRIFVMKDGEIIEEGKHLDLISQQGEYFKFHQLQGS